MPRRAKNARRQGNHPRPARRDAGAGGGWGAVVATSPGPPRSGAGLVAATRVMALDVGERRIGIAVSDESRRVAMPLTTLHRSGDDLVTLAELAAEWDIGSIVVGMPTGLSGREGPQAAVVRAWVRVAEGAIDRPFRYWDERFSSLIAERTLAASGIKPDRRRGDIDAMAAAVILQGYLDAQRHRGRHDRDETDDESSDERTGSPIAG
ncbi:MAG: Holliday junction resolvase RuvX [Chloroflexota bacterium]|nr:Holliday junction resolvase RuvX [Chloroflexota bacterium]